MATYDELMAALRKADAAGDAAAAQAIARRAAAAKPVAMSADPVAPVISPSEPAIPRLPVDAPINAPDPMAQIASLMAPVQPVIPGGAPGMMGGMGEDQLDRARQEAAAKAATEVAVPAAPVAPDPFAGEGFGDLLSRRGQQVAQGAAEVVASVPEAAALVGRDILTSRLASVEAASPAVAAERSQLEAIIREFGPAAQAGDWEAKARVDAASMRLTNLAGQEAMIGRMGSEDRTAASRPVSETPMFKVGDAVREGVASVTGAPDPRDDGFWAKVAQGGGNMLGMIGASLAAAPLGGAPASLAVGAGTGSAMNSSQIYKEAIGNGVDEPTALEAARWGGVIGAGEIIPIGRALNLLPPRLKSTISTAFMRRFADIAQGAGEEAAQEYLSQVANNIVAQKLYDPSRGWADGATESALIGAILGGGVGAIGTAGEAVTKPPEPKQRDREPAPAAQATPEAQIAALMAPQAPDAPPASPQAEPAPAAPTAPAADPMAQIAAAMTGQQSAPAPAPPPAQPKSEPAATAPAPQPGDQITRAEAEANPDRFEIIPESEGQGGTWRATGRELALDKTTGRVIPIATDAGGATDARPIADAPARGAEPAGANPAGEPMGGGATAQPALEGRGGQPEQPAGAGDAKAGAAAQGDTIGGPALTPPGAPRNFEFIDQTQVPSIGTEPGVMQYKAGGDAQGVTDRLRGVTEWRPERAGMSIIYEYADGRRVIADGHQRLGLAKRLAAEGKPVQMPAIILRQADGISPEEARVAAALKNIAEGSGTALDAAKVLRGTDQSAEQLGLPPTSAIVRDAMGMRNLSDVAFGMIVNGVATERDGGIVGRVVADPAAQANILALIARLQKDRPMTAFQAESVAQQAAADTVIQTQDSLFGPEADTKNLYLERAKVLEAATRMTRDEMRAFRNVVENADRLQAAGNRLDAGGNQSAVDSAATMRDYLQREANTKGAISDALTAAARALADGATVQSATRAFLAAAERQLAARGGDGAGRDSGGQEAGSQRPQESRDQGVTPPQGRDEAATAGDLFSPPQTGQSPDQARAQAEAETRAAQSKMRRTGGNDGAAGPLFDTQGDLLSGPAAAPQATPEPAPEIPGVALIDKGRAALEAHTKPGDAEFDATTGKDLRDTDHGRKLAASLQAAKTDTARRKAADDFVRVWGRKTGAEHLVVLDKAGVPLAIMSGTRTGVSAHAAVFRAAEAGLVGYVTHNHPRNTGPSGSDMAMVYAGFSPLTVVGHDGVTITIDAAEKVAANWSGRSGDIPKIGDLADALGDLKYAAETKANAQALDMTGDGLSAADAEKLWQSATRRMTAAILDRMGAIRYDGATDAIAEIERAGFNFEDIYGQVSGNERDRLRRAGLVFTDGGNRSGNRAAGEGAATAPRAADRTDQQPQGDGGASRVVTGNAALDGALDDIFGADGDVSGTGNDLERGGRSGAPADGMGGTDVPASAGQPGQGAGRRGRADRGGNRQRRAGGPVSDGNAAPVGERGNLAAAGTDRADSQPAAGRDGGRGDGNRDQRLPADGAGKGDVAGNAAGTAAGKLTPAERLAAIRNILKEDVIDFVAGPERASTDTDAFRKWFGDSKVVDADGKPLVVYHGRTAANDGIAEFDVGARSGYLGRPQAGAFFSADREYAASYAADGAVVPAYLSIQNPLVTNNNPAAFSADKMADLQAKGYDGLIWNDAEFGDFAEIIAFSPSQIKSVFNRGTWDASSPYILREDAAQLDPRKAEALESIFIGALEGVDIAASSDRQLFAAIMLPLKDVGMTRAEVAQLSPYLEAFLSDLRAGRINLDAAPATATPAIEADDRVERQAVADKTRVVFGDKGNIDATLPLLLPEQRDDVLKAETRFAKSDGHGFMLTNGTGTGKTYSAGGAIKRFYQAGKKNILIIAPDATLPGWGRTLDALGVPASRLSDTKDAGEGVVYTTHQNAGANDALAAREWDMVVVDEAQYLSQNADGAPTAALGTVRAITGRPQDLWRRSRMLHAADWAAHAKMRDGDAKTATYRRLKEREDREVAAWAAKPRPKVLFLSATPFAYDKSIDYAEGYLFNYPQDGRVNGSNQSGRNLFMVQNFGYRIRYHKLTRPEHAVDSAVFEREFHEKLRREGVLSGRSLQVDVDYDRRFVTVADAIGTEIDAILKTLSEGTRDADKALADGYRTLDREISKRFDYLARQQLLEAIKAKAAVPDIQKHLALGRKVVVFHDFNKGGGFNPFSGLRILDDANAIKALSDLTARHPGWEKLDFSSYAAPVDTLKAAFGKRAGVFSGLTKKDRDAQLTAFNTDGSGVDVLVVQADAGGAGISMHDLTGKHRRVLINLGMPTKPTTTLQQEGRILRVGTMTDAAFRYYTIGTAWEREAFAKRIAERSGTVENLALGNEARAITEAFVDAYMDAEAFDPSDADGKGGKAKDRSGAVTTPWQKAVAHYFGRMKTTGRRDQRQGLDFYPTPEPLALKMVEWAGIRPNERVLEPSAGDGAIARYMPDFAAITLVEPSSDLGSTALLRQPRANLVSGRFEDLHIVNKAHVIVMNPPFGQGGTTAIAHVAKATRHLRPGGRIVALIPSGPAADRRFAAWWDGEAAEGLTLAADVSLPAVAFERAGTSVMTRVVVIDKSADGQPVAPDTQRLNFTGATSIKDFFDRLEGYEVRRRPEAVADPVAEIEAEGQDATSPVPVQRPGPAIGGGVQFVLKATKHSKTGEPLFVATIENRVDREVYMDVLSVAKRHGGWYSNFRGNGAVPGFQFKSEAARQAFLGDMEKPTVGGFEETADEGFTAEQRQPVGLTDAVIAATLGAATSHADHAAAKSGDLAAGIRVAESILTKDVVSEVKKAIADKKPIIVPVVSVESTGRNKIPTGAAIVLADRLGLPATGDIVQVNSPQRTSMSGLDRIFSPPVFDGPVQAGADYLLLDDTVTQGATFAAMEAHIVANGGRVVAAVALTGKQYSATLRLQPETLAALREKHGDIESDFRAVLGYGFDALTESEARYLTKFEPADGIRNRIAEERSAIRSGSGQGDAAPRVTQSRLVRDAAAATSEIRRLMPALRAELDRLDLKRVKLSQREGDVGWQGAFTVTGDGEMEIVIGASLDPMKTLHHEVIHALRAMNLFTPEEWRALTIAAERGWAAKHDIAERYPHLTEAERIEEAIAEEFTEALAKKQAPKGSILIAAFNKIARLFKAFRNVLNGAGFQTADDVFGRVLAGEIGARGAENTGAAMHVGVRQQTEPLINTDTEAFRKWFGDSKVVDANGKPLVVYHGSPDLRFINEDGVFKSQKGRIGLGRADAAHWFTTSLATAKTYADPRRAFDYQNAEEGVVAAYIRLENPLIIDGRGQNWRDAQKLGKTSDVIEEARKGGHDGAIIHNVKDDYNNGKWTRPTDTYVVFEPTQIKSATGNRGTFDANDPRIMFQQKPRAVRPMNAQGRAHRNSAVGAVPFIPDRRIWETLTAAGVPVWQRLRDLPGAASDAVDRARYVIQDRFLPVLRAQEAVERQIGRPLPADHDAYTKETTFSGRVGRHLLDVDETFTKPVIKIIAASKGRMTADSVGQWLYARHAVERNAYIASINPTMPDGGSGMMDAEANQILQDIAASPDAAAYDSIGKMVDDLREWGLKLREDAGLISNADAQLWRTQYKHYVPLKGFDETDHAEAMMELGGVRTGRRFSIRGAESRRAMGRQSEAFNPLQSAITMAQEVAIRAEKNRVAQSLYDLAKSYPSDALWQVKAPAMKRYFNRSTGLVETRVENPVTAMMEPNEMAVKISGKEHRILFKDQRLAEAAGTLGADQMHSILRVLSMFSRFFSMTRTMLNPEFVVTNAMRDFQTAQFNIQAFGEADKGRIAAAMAKNWRKAFLGVMRGQSYRFDTEWSRYFDEFQKSGAQVWFWTMEQPEAAKDDLAKRVELARGSRARRALKVMTTPSAFFSFRDNAALAFIERVNMAVDNAIRLAAFVEARRAGWDVEKAAFLAKELTVNFNRRGEAGPAMNALYPFFNAAVQGSARTIKALVTSRRVAAMVATAFAGGLILDLVNAALSEDDDDGEKFYDKVPNYRNERNLHFVLWGKGDNPAAIPMPYGYNLFPYAGQQLGKVLRGVKAPDQAFGDVMAAAFGAFSPISAATPAQMLAPAIADPVVEMAENKNWVGVPIYPETFGNQTEPDAYVHFRGATEVSKWVAQSLNGLTGGDFRQSGFVDVSPETLDHLATFVTGSAGAFWGRTADLVTKAAQGDFDQIEARSVPFLRNVISPVGDWANRDRYYRFGAEVKDANADLKAYEEAGVTPPPRTLALANLYEDWLAAERERKGKGEWNPSKPGALAARAEGAVFLDFGKKYLRIMGRQGE